MTNILYVHQVSAIGGASYCLLNILKEVDRAKINPIVLLQSEGPLVDEIKKLCIEIHILPNLWSIPYNTSVLKRSTLYNYKHVYKSTPYVKAFLESKNIDIVYLNNMMLYPYLKIAKSLGLKTIIHIREHWPVKEHILQLNIARRFIRDYADHVVAINNYSASIVSNIEYKTTIVYDWIDFKDRYQEYPFSKIFGEDCSKLKVYLYTGGLLRIKGPLEVLEAFIYHIKDNDCRLLMLGDYNINYYIGIRGKIKKLLSLFGIKSYEQRAQKLIKSDSRIICVPNTYKIKHLMEQAYCYISFYNIPHANLAMAESIILNTPSIVAYTSESEEYAAGGELAYLYRFKDKKDFLNKIDDLNANYNQFKSLLRARSSEVKSLFDKQVNVNKISNIYDNII